MQTSAECACFVGSRMAYDEDLANRVRERVADMPDMTEKQMFGGLGFLVAGNVAVTVSFRGGLMVRVDKTKSDRLVATTKATVVEMRGRLMPGWLRVEPEDVRTTRQLKKWVTLGIDVARTLPPKR